MQYHEKRMLKSMQKCLAMLFLYEARVLAISILSKVLMQVEDVPKRQLFSCAATIR